MAPRARHLRRRDVLVQLGAVALTAGCGPAATNPPAPSGDTAAGGDDAGDDTAAGGDDTAAGGDDTAAGGDDTAAGGDDTGGDSGGDTGGDDTGTPEAWDRAECDQGDQPLPDGSVGPTPGMSEGPFFREDLPERAELDVRGDQATVLILTGRLLQSDRSPVPGVKVCLWHANDEGFYDTESDDFHLYGWQQTAEDGSFCFRTSRPAPYPDYDNGGFNPGHLHWKLYDSDGAELFITQHTFEDDPYHAEDGEFAPANILAVETVSDGVILCRFDLILAESG